MADALAITTTIRQGSGQSAGDAWNWYPAVPMAGSPLASWPIRPLVFLGNVVRSWLPVSDNLFVAGLSLLTWFFLSPALERCREFQVDWIAEIYVRNLGLLALVAGGLHLYLYTFRRQGDHRRYDSRPFHKDNRRYSFANQVFDNMFWSLASGVIFWTAFEVLGMWAYANGLMSHLAWNTNPAWFIALFVLIPLFGVFHFYWIHRWLHWPPLYRTVHFLHHRNVNIGPWSGLSMHPVEHALYLSSVLIHVVVASHPLHLIFHLQQKALIAVTSHSGFETVTAGPVSDSGVRAGDFFHQLHHRYFECNYGDPGIPCDQWFGSFHDGTPEATRRSRKRMSSRSTGSAVGSDRRTESLR